MDALALALRAQGKTVAILAVDPSSRVSGGAILGDRIRMQQHHADPGIFIRSMATRGTVGGLARATADLARLMDAAGKDYVLIETVGVGQDEIEIAGLAQVTVVVLVPGMGDDVQAIKAGIMEIADIFVINKADQSRRRPRGTGNPRRRLATVPRRSRTVATEGKGIAELLAAIDSIRAADSAQRDDAAPAPEARPSTTSASPSATSTKPSPSTNPSASPSPIAKPSPQEKVDVAMLPAGDSRIELLEPTAPDSPIAKFLEKRGPACTTSRCACRTSRRRRAAQRAAGARLLNEPRTGAGGHIYVFVHPGLHRRRAARTDSGEQELDSGNRNHRRQRTLPHARIRSPGRGRHHDALRQPVGQLRPRHAGRTARWPSSPATAAATASRPRS